VAAIDQRTSHLWAIILKGGDHIGNISAHRDLPNGTAEVGILLGDATVHGRGYGTEAWRAVCDWLFETGIRKISAGAMTENQPMRRIFEKCGMSEDGIRRGHLLLDGRPRDVVHVALFRKP
jgi:RimJ/RimL family protein N-acetyltransferase